MSLWLYEQDNHISPRHPIFSPLASVFYTGIGSAHMHIFFLHCVAFTSQGGYFKKVCILRCSLHTYQYETGSFCVLNERIHCTAMTSCISDTVFAVISFCTCTCNSVTFDLSHCLHTCFFPTHCSFIGWDCDLQYSTSSDVAAFHNASSHHIYLNVLLSTEVLFIAFRVICSNSIELTHLTPLWLQPPVLAQGGQSLLICNTLL